MIGLRNKRLKYRHVNNCQLSPTTGGSQFTFIWTSESIDHILVWNIITKNLCFVFIQAICWSWSWRTSLIRIHTTWLYCIAYTVCGKAFDFSELNKTVQPKSSFCLTIKIFKITKKRKCILPGEFISNFLGFVAL